MFASKLAEIFFLLNKVSMRNKLYFIKNFIYYWKNFVRSVISLSKTRFRDFFHRGYGIGFFFKIGRGNCMTIASVEDFFEDRFHLIMLCIAFWKHFYLEIRSSVLVIQWRKHCISLRWSSISLTWRQFWRSKAWFRSPSHLIINKKENKNQP